MRRSLVLMFMALFALPACGGGAASTLNTIVSSGGSGSTPTSGKRSVAVTLTIPSTGTSSSSIVRHPKTVSSSTQSVTVSVNGATPQVFNISSGNGCTTGNNGTTCTFNVGAPYGLDTFLILTYGGTNASGAVLNAAAETIDVTQAGPNSFTATAGNVVYVTTNTDSGAGSLRAAVAAAASGVTTAILFQNVTGTITLSSPITIAQSVAIIGPGASSLTVSGGGSISMFTVNSGENAVFYGLTFANGASTSGGAIFSDGNLSVFSSTFSSNTASVAGGAIDVDNGTLVATGDTFSGNTVNAPSVQYPAGGAINSYGDATIDSSTFQNNSVSQSTSGGIAVGGAICECDYETQGLVLTNSQFYGNSVTSSAGSAYAGAVEDSSGAPMLTIAGDTFGKTGAGNTISAQAATGGGAVEFFNFNGGTLTDAGIGGNSFVANSALTGSGGYSEGGAIVLDATDDTLYFTGPSNSFTGNSAIAGAVASGGAIEDLDTGGTITISASTTFTSNVAKTTDASDGGAFGGAISYYSFPCEAQQQSIARQTGASQSHASGGRSAVAVRRAFTSSSRRSSSNRHAASKRQPMLVTPSTSTISGTFTSNTAGPSAMYGAAGGAIDLETQTDVTPAFTISNATITSNAVTGTGFYGDGGGIDMFSGTLTITGSTIGSQGKGNQASTRGGGVVIGYAGGPYITCGTLYPGILTIANSTIAGNTLSGSNISSFGGGGVSNASSTVTITGSTIAFNSVSNSTTGGGGILAYGGGQNTSTQIFNSTIFSNTSSNNGGGIMNAANSSFISDFYFYN
ncbi:MAG: hypothetical protein ABSE64_15940, partial [Vulcanimicrobiaceae bacterium]